MKMVKIWMFVSFFVIMAGKKTKELSPTHACMLKYNKFALLDPDIQRFLSIQESDDVKVISQPLLSSLQDKKKSPFKFKKAHKLLIEGKVHFSEENDESSAVCFVENAGIPIDLSEFEKLQNDVFIAEDEMGIWDKIKRVWITHRMLRRKLDNQESKKI